MANSGSRELPDEDANKMLGEILEEDEDEELGEEESTSCPAICAEEDFAVKRVCDCMRIAENSSRFSLRVMEAMRSLQQEEDAFLPTCSAEDIVGYIEANYRDDGDLYAQVRTVLKQVCSQGFVMELLKNEYHLVGPDAISMNKFACSNDRGECLLSSPPKDPAKRRKKDEDSCNCVDESKTKQKRPRPSRRRVSVGRGNLGRNRTNSSRRIVDAETGEDLDEEEEEDTINESLNDEDARTDDTLESAIQVGNEMIGSAYSVNKGKTTELFQYSPFNIWRRIRTRSQESNGRNENGGAGVNETATGNGISENARGDENDSTTEETLSDNSNAFQEPQKDNQVGKTKDREKELERWIKRCQAECVRRGKRRTNN